ncbi:MAG: adenosylhomocysteinase [Archaeoglobus sp.]|uniref:adenosylhomocysteinase n=1 Tax=Archaeoglobus sp. TaxID=1872626 RepID=UPI001D2044D9|nr:adenosylhomocysteinase [Archaeoglobus sp.]MBO8180465.1 adenosylhomocysteinase [Archaeoglobus sp.]
MISVDWYHERMKLVRRFARDIEVEEVAVCIPLEYKSASLICELSKYTNVYAAKLDDFSTKPEVVEWLKERGVEVKRKRDVIDAECYLDCAAVLSRVAVKSGKKELKVVELTKTGEEYLQKLNVRMKAISLDSSTLKGVGENIHGTSFGLLDALLRLNIFLPEKRILVLGFGRVGKGCARLLKAVGCPVTVWDNDEKKQIEAIYEGFRVERDFDVDIVVTCTGVKGVVSKDEIRKIPDRSILLNMGAEMEIEPAGELVKDYGLVKKYELEGKEYFVVANGYAANLALGNGTPIEVMDRTFSAAILALNYLHRNDFVGLIPLPHHIESTILAAIMMQK